jgi:polyisoprenoid-binding protein YceI
MNIMKTKNKLAFLLLAGILATSVQAQTLEQDKIESSVTYTLSHLLHTFDAVSKDVMFHVDADVAAKKIKTVTAQVDVTTFDSGNSNRDSHAMEVIDAITYPYVAFTGTSVTQYGDSLRVEGKLTFHGVTKDIVMLGKTIWTQNKLEVQGNFVLSLTAFNIERPALLLVPVSDDLHFFLKAVFNLK